MYRVSQACDNYDLKISTKGTEVMHAPAPGKTYNEPANTVNGQRLQVVDTFTSLGNTLSRAVHFEDGVTARMVQASIAFGSLRGNIWHRIGIRLDTKLKSKKITNDQELIQSDPTSCPQNQKGNN